MSNQSLLKPLKLGPLTLKNRVVMSALTRSRSIPNTVPNDVNLLYYKQRANAGLIVSEGTLISQQGTEWPWAPGIWNKEQIAAWKKINDTVHAEGGLIFCQLWHLGRVLHPDMPEQIASGQPVYGPTAIAAEGGKFRQLPGTPGYVTPTELDDAAIENIIALYKQAAINAKEAGFDGVELHAANGYLIAQFFDSGSNRRTDKWGGSAEKRSRFGLEVLKVLVEVWGADRVGVKVSPAGGYNDMGMPLQDTLDTFGYFIKEADKLNVAYILVCRYLALFDPAKRGTEHDVVASYGPLIKNSQRWFNGGFTPDEANTLISEGKADAIAFGFPWIANPDFAKRIQDGKEVSQAVDFPTFYGAGGDLEAQKKGYTDWPEAA